MKPARGPTRRYLPTSPFKPPPPPPPPEQYAVDDRVSHDTYGLGTVLSVERDASVVVAFGADRKHLALPCAKLFKL